MTIDPYLVGILYGDGWTYLREPGSYVTCIDQAEKNKRIILEEVIPRFRKMGFPAKPYRYFAKHDGIFKWRAQVYSKPLHLELKRIFHNVVLYFEELSDQDSKQFIAGFFDAEGTVIVGRLILYNTNVALLQAIQRILERTGMRPLHIYRYNIVFGLTISRKALIKRFAEEIPALKFKMYGHKLAL